MGGQEGRQAVMQGKTYFVQEMGGFKKKYQQYGGEKDLMSK